MNSLESVQSILRSYYAVFNAGGADAATLDAVLSPTWRNYSSETEYAEKSAFLAALAGIQQAVPDLRWRIDEVLLAGDRVIVRGEGSGRPTTALFGVPGNGRAFRLMSMDIHTIHEGRIQRTYHLEDWAQAMQQLSAK